MARPPVPCEQRVGRRVGCTCHLCRARHNGQQAAYRARLRDVLRRPADQKGHHTAWMVLHRSQLEHKDVRWRCWACGRVAIGPVCPCGQASGWAE